MADPPTYAETLTRLMPYQPPALVEALARPTADGLLILALADEWQSAGLAQGDIIVAAAGMQTPDMENLAGALVAESGTVPISAVRRGTPVTVDAPARLDAVQPLAVSAGVPVVLRAPSTDPAVDAERVDRDLDIWLRLAVDGHHVGFEHHLWSRDGTELELVSEVAMDDGRQQIHVVAASRLRIEPGRLVPLESALELPLTGTLAESSISETADGYRWTTAHEFADERTTRVVDVPSEALPEFVVNQMGLFLPPDVGWVQHVTPVYEGTGQVAFPGFPAALVATSADPLAVHEGMVAALRVEKRVLGQPQMAMWFAADGPLCAVDYGWASATLASRDDALGDAVPDLRPRTLD